VTTFIVRVQLVDSDSDNYPPLWEAMEEEGFSRTVIDSKGTVYRLPHGTYRTEEASSAGAILAKARSAVKSLGLKARILVVPRGGTIKMSNLEEDDDSWVELEELFNT
jgi:hypothetical protein